MNQIVGLVVMLCAAAQAGVVGKISPVNMAIRIGNIPTDAPGTLGSRPLILGLGAILTPTLGPILTPALGPGVSGPTLLAQVPLIAILSHAESEPSKFNVLIKAAGPNKQARAVLVAELGSLREKISSEKPSEQTTLIKATLDELFTGAAPSPGGILGPDGNPVTSAEPGIVSVVPQTLRMGSNIFERQGAIYVAQPPKVLYSALSPAAAIEGLVSAREFEDAKQPHSTTALKRVLALGLVFFSIEVVGSMITGSLALRADATHMAVDLSVTAGALLCNWLSRRPPGSSKTHGDLEKVEPLMGLLSSVAIIAIAGHMTWEAVGRLSTPVAVTGWPTILLALSGLFANVISALILFNHRDQSLSLKGAYLHAATDALGSVGVIVAAILMMAFGWFIADPIISFVIVALILHTTWDLAKHSWNALVIGSEHGKD